MAIFYLGVKAFGRARGKNGSRATSGAAYRAGERIRDERTGHVYDHRGRRDVLHKEIVLPARLAARRAALDWALDRSRLWNAAEHAESRRNARVAREFAVALPHELAPAARTRLAREFAQQIADRYGSAVDLAIHAPRGDARNFHAHLLSTTREVTPEGLGRKTALELSGTARHRLGLPRWRDELGALRERWAVLTNRALEQASVPARVSHLGRARRGLEPGGPPRLPLAAYHIEQRGGRSFVAERIRERYRAELERARPAAERTGWRRLGAGMAGAWRTLQARFGLRAPAAQEAASRLALVPAHDRSDAARHAVPAMRAPTPARAAERTLASRPSTLDELALASALRWRAIREQVRSRGLAEWPEHDPAHERTPTPRHEPDHGLAL